MTSGDDQFTIETDSCSRGVLQLEIGQIFTNSTSLTLCTAVRINRADRGNRRASTAFEISRHFTRTFVTKHKK